MNVLVDSSVILDILTDDPKWADWSEPQIAELSADHALIINDIIWAECSAAFKRIEDYRATMAEFRFLHHPMPHAALFLAAKAFVAYRRNGGTRTSPLPDFFIGAHAAVSGMEVLTRDPKRILSHFPTVRIIAP